jgi:hypothetical protein
MERTNLLYNDFKERGKITYSSIMRINELEDKIKQLTNKKSNAIKGNNELIRRNNELIKKNNSLRGTNADLIKEVKEANVILESNKLKVIDLAADIILKKKEIDELNTRSDKIINSIKEQEKIFKSKIKETQALNIIVKKPRPVVPEGNEVATMQSKWQETNTKNSKAGKIDSESEEEIDDIIEEMEEASEHIDKKDDYFIRSKLCALTVAQVRKIGEQYNVDGWKTKTKNTIINNILSKANRVPMMKEVLKKY